MHTQTDKEGEDEQDEQDEQDEKKASRQQMDPNGTHTHTQEDTAEEGASQQIDPKVGEDIPELLAEIRFGFD